MGTSTRSTAGISLLLAAAGVLQVGASAQRWWPACRSGDFETAACLRVQDHHFDFVLPQDGWVPLGHVAVLAGLSLLLLGTAVTLLPLLLRPWRRAAHVWALCAVLGLSQLLAGLSTLVSGLLGRAAVDLWTPFVAFVWLGWPVALTLASILMVGHVRRPGAGWLLLIVLLTREHPARPGLHDPGGAGVHVPRHHAVVRGVGWRLSPPRRAGRPARGVPSPPPRPRRDPGAGARHDVRPGAPGLGRPDGRTVSGST